MQDRYRQPAWATSRPRWSILVYVMTIGLSIYWSDFPGRWLPVLLSILGLLVISLWLTLFNDIVVNESGIKIKIFQLFWVSRLWNDVMCIADLPTTPWLYRIVGILYYQRGGGGTWKLLQIQKLPWPYHLACWIGVGDVWAGILLPPQMVARDALEMQVRKGIAKAGREG
jgi:hypothetical protein